MSFLLCLCYWSGGVCLLYLACKALFYPDNIRCDSKVMRLAFLYDSQNQPYFFAVKPYKFLSFYPESKFDSLLYTRSSNIEEVFPAILLQWEYHEHKQGLGTCAKKKFDPSLNSVKIFFVGGTLLLVLIMSQTVQSQIFSEAEWVRRLYTRYSFWFNWIY